jgi:hypothetical protein
MKVGSRRQCGNPDKVRLVPFEDLPVAGQIALPALWHGSQLFELTQANPLLIGISISETKSAGSISDVVSAPVASMQPSRL